jgi:hypothetical protein
MILSRKPNTISKYFPIALALSFILSACNNESSQPEAVNEPLELHGIWEKMARVMCLLLMKRVLKIASIRA